MTNGAAKFNLYLIINIILGTTVDILHMQLMACNN